MGRKAIHDELIDFRDWLISEGRSMSTAKGYVSNARCVLREVKDRTGNQGFIDTYFEGIKPELVPARLTAWRAYAAYMLFEAETVVMVPKDRREKKGAAKSAEPLPLDVCASIRKLKDAAVTYRVMTLLVWEDVEFASGAPGSYIHVRDPLKLGEWYRVEREAIEVLMQWAKPIDYAEDQPLIPLEPGSDQPYPKRGLQREAQRGAPSLEEKVKAMRAAARSKEGSALGAAYRPDLNAITDIVTPENYHSDYLPKPKETDTVEGLLGLGGPERTEDPDPPRVEETRPALIESDDEKPLAVAVQELNKSHEMQKLLREVESWPDEGIRALQFIDEGIDFSNDLPRPEGAGNGHGTAVSAKNGTAVSAKKKKKKKKEGEEGEEGEEEATAYPSSPTEPTPVEPDMVEVQKMKTAAKLLGVPEAHLKAVLDLLKGPAPDPELKKGPGALFPEVPDGYAYMAPEQMGYPDGDDPAPIVEKPPRLGDDGLLYDPNDPDYAEKGDN